MKRVYFKGNAYVFCGDNSKPMRGAIATDKQYRNGEISFAFLHGDGSIIRYDKKIGVLSDLVFAEDIAIKPSENALSHVKEQIFDIVSGS